MYASCPDYISVLGGCSDCYPDCMCPERVFQLLS